MPKERPSVDEGLGKLWFGLVVVEYEKSPKIHAKAFFRCVGFRLRHAWESTR